MRKEQKDELGLIKGFIILAVVVILIMVFAPISMVGAGERCVLLEWGAVTGTIWNEGLHWRIPVMQSCQMMDVRTQKYVDTASSASKDLQDVSTEIALNYHLEPTKVDFVFQTIGTQFGERVIAPAIEDSVKAGTAQFTAEELITKRALARETIQQEMQKRLESYGIVVESLSITNFQFSAKFTQAIESKVEAEQMALKAENDLVRIKTEAEQQIALAQAEAEAIRIKGEALKQNPELVQLEWVNKWNGVMPQFMTGSGSSMLMDVSGFMQ